MFTPVRDLLSSMESLAGTEISISGRLLVGLEHLYLADDYDAYARGERIAVDDGGIIVSCMNPQFSPYGGGDVMFDEAAYVTGTLEPNGEGYRLTRLRYCKIVGEQSTIEIPFPAGLP